VRGILASVSLSCQWLIALELHDIKNTPMANIQPCELNSPVNITKPVRDDKAMGKEIRTLPSSNMILYCCFKTG
jgi:hypothetical protein